VSSIGPLLSGTRSPATGDTKCTSPSSDQIVAAAIAGNTTFKSLVLRAQAAFYIAGFSAYGREYLSWKSDGKGGAVPVPATISPKAAYDSLFFNFVPATGADPTQR